MNEKLLKIKEEIESPHWFNKQKGVFSSSEENNAEFADKPWLQVPDGVYVATNSNGLTMYLNAEGQYLCNKCFQPLLHGQAIDHSGQCEVE